MESYPTYVKFFEATIWQTEDKKWHRLDGPAFLGRINQWWINNWPVDHVIEPWAKEAGIDLENLTEEDKILIQIKWENYDGS